MQVLASIHATSVTEVVCLIPSSNSEISEDSSLLTRVRSLCSVVHLVMTVLNKSLPDCKDIVLAGIGQLKE